MSDDQLQIVWRQEPTSYPYFYGETSSRYSAQIGVASEGGFAWVIFDSKVRGAIWGGTTSTVEEAKSAAQQWLYQFARP